MNYSMHVCKLRVECPPIPSRSVGARAGPAAYSNQQPAGLQRAGTRHGLNKPWLSGGSPVHTTRAHAPSESSAGSDSREPAPPLGRLGDRVGARPAGPSAATVGDRSAQDPRRAPGRRARAAPPPPPPTPPTPPTPIYPAGPSGSPSLCLAGVATVPDGYCRRRPAAGRQVELLPLPGGPDGGARRVRPR